MKKGILSVGLLFFLIGGVVQSEENTFSLGYDQLDQLIREKNGSVQSSIQLLDASRVRTDSFKRSFLPQISASLGSEVFYNGGMNQARLQPVGSLDLLMNLSRGGQDEQEEAIRQAQVGLALVQSHKVYATELMHAQQLYWDIVFSDEMISRTQDSLKQNAKSYDATKRRFQRGLLTQSDLMAFEIYKSRLEEAVESLNHEKKILVMKLQALLGLPETTVLFLTQQSLLHEHREDFLKEVLASDQAYEIQELIINEQILGFQIAKMTGKNKPSIDLFSTYTLYTEAERSFANVTDRAEVAGGIRAQFLLFDGNQNQSELKSLTIKRAALSEFLTYKKHLVFTELKAFQEELIHLHDLLHHSESRLSKTKTFLHYVFEDYDRGVKNSTDVLTALQVYQEMQENYVRQKRAYQKIKSELLALIPSRK